MLSHETTYTPARGRKKLLTHVDKEQKEVDTYETYFI